MKNNINIIIIDDHVMFLEGVTSLLENCNDINILGTAKNVDEAFKLCENVMPDIILTDIEMPDKDGLQFTKQIKHKNAKIKVIALTSHSNPSIISKAQKANVDGYLLKKSGRIELLKAIYTVYNGNTYFTHEIQQKLKKETKLEIILSPREKQVLKLIFEEKNTIEISKALFISVNTVETHRKNLMRKSGAKNMIGLMKYAISNHII